MRVIILFITLLFPFFITAQTESQTVFSFSDFEELVKKYHPVAGQAGLLPKTGKATILSARGNFDPSIYTDLDQKYFEDKKYFSLLNSGLKLPTWYGIELKGGYEQNQGVYLSDENILPTQGLAYAGISLPIGQGLFIDQRRATLQQAKLFAQSTGAQQQIMLNELIYNAGKTYWDWFLAYNNFLIYESALQAAEVRFSAVKQSAQMGDRPFIDTLEAGIQLQDRTLAFQQSTLEFKNKSLELSNYLWYENNIPLELDENTIPVAASNLSFSDNEIKNFISKLDSLQQTHPALTISRIKIATLEVERKLKTEKLKPVLNINYNALSVPVNSDALTNYSINNYKWGLSFYMPLLLRKERGELQLTKLKLTDANYELQNKNLELLNKSKAGINEHSVSIQQVKLYSKTVRDYESLLEAEKRMFEGGESSLFMINARELSAINARIKLTELITKTKKALLTVEYSFGELGF